MIVLGLAPLAAWFFGQPSLVPILRVMALSFVLGGLSSLGPVLLQRELAFHRILLLNVSVGFVNLCSAAIAAVLLRNVWALVIGELAGVVCALLMSYLVHSFRPRLRFVRSRARQVFSFGKYLTATGIVTFLSTQGDDAYVGKVLGTESLGFYRLAYRLSNMPATSLSHVVNRVTLPALSATQDDIARMRNIYLHTLRLIALVAVPIAGGMFALAPYVVGVLYGSNWMPAVPSFMVLCLFGLERAIGSTAGPVFLAVGKPNLLMYVVLGKLIVMALCIVPLTRLYGYLGTGVAVTISAVFVQALAVLVISRLLHVTKAEVFQQMAKPLGVTCLMMVAIFGMRQVAEWPINLVSLVILSFSGLIAYSVVVLPTERQILRKVVSSLLPEAGVGIGGR
jgi:O-antigen/teichoic acid export membrane protein